MILEAVIELVIKTRPYDVDNDDKFADILNAIVERPYETIEERDDTPGFVAPAATLDNPYETIEERDDTP